MRPIVVVVDTLPAEGKTFPLEIPAQEINGFLASEGVSEAEAVGDAVGEAKAYRSGRDVFVLGTVRVRIAYQCVRCLEPFEEDLKTDFHRVFSAEEEYGAGEVELRKEDLDVEPIEGDSIDLARVAAEEISLALRAHPVCREACRGLCPTCGANLNAEQCRCPPAPVDPRFAVLGTVAPKKK
ncbi:MAG: DUF177 domain-containing protein [Deltaproteobacteria bacterium]|nr:DUF177 domain-containing protein [Deltaproteobacteria bacterium]